MAVTSAGAVSATAAQGASSGGFKLFGGKGISFMDVLKVVGGGLLGGPIGAALSFAGVVAEKTFSKDDGAETATPENSTPQTAAATPAQEQIAATAVADNGVVARPGGWMINMAYGARDPYALMGGSPPATTIPGTAVASTAINDPRLNVASRGVQERPGGWMINAAYGLNTITVPLTPPGTAIAATI